MQRNTLNQNKNSNQQCPICTTMGSHWSKTPSSYNQKGILILNCKKCSHKWFPYSNRRPFEDAKEILSRESSEIRRWIKNKLPREVFTLKDLNVLDVGCWDGDLLKTLPQSWSLYGVEPNVLAANIAISRGITVFTDLIDQIPLNKTFFDIVFMMNILEHLTDPLTDLIKISQSMKTGGAFFAVTGNSNSIASNFYKGAWYYFNYNEHVSFFSPKSIKTLLDEAGIKTISVKPVRHHSAKYTLTVKKIFYQLFNSHNEKKSYLLKPINKIALVKLIASRLTHSRDHLFIYGIKKG